MKFPLNLPHYSLKKLVCASVLLIFLPVMQPAQAAGEFGVDNVTVDAQGKDTTDARTKAMAMGEKDAFAQLMLRLNPPNVGDILKSVTPAQVSSMVRGYTVTDEKMTLDHYHATVNYNFDPHAIQSLVPAAPAPAMTPPQAMTPPSMNAGGATAAAVTIPEPAPVSKAVLVLPVYNDGTSSMLWQNQNKWRNIWYEAALESGGGLVVVPQGDMNDRVDVDDTNVNTATPESLKRMYGRYGVGQIIVLSAVYNEKADPKPALEVTVTRILPDKPQVSLLTYTIHSTENLDQLMARASNDIARAFYKEQTLDPNKIEYDRVKEINARINTTDIKEWEELRKRLLARSNIVGVRMNSISYYETTMTITFKGTADMLGKTLVVSGLRVMQDGDSLVLAIK